MTERTSDDDDFADYTDDHQDKPAPDPAEVDRADTPDVADLPESEPPD